MNWDDEYPLNRDLMGRTDDATLIAGLEKAADAWDHAYAHAPGAVASGSTFRVHPSIPERQEGR